MELSWNDAFITVRLVLDYYVFFLLLLLYFVKYHFFLMTEPAVGDLRFGVTWASAIDLVCKFDNRIIGRIRGGITTRIYDCAIHSIRGLVGCDRGVSCREKNVGCCVPVHITCDLVLPISRVEVGIAQTVILSHRCVTATFKPLRIFHTDRVLNEGVGLVKRHVDVKLDGLLVFGDLDPVDDACSVHVRFGKVSDRPRHLNDTFGGNRTDAQTVVFVDVVFHNADIRCRGKNVHTVVRGALRQGASFGIESVVHTHKVVTVDHHISTDDEASTMDAVVPSDVGLRSEDGTFPGERFDVKRLTKLDGRCLGEVPKKIGDELGAEGIAFRGCALDLAVFKTRDFFLHLQHIGKVHSFTKDIDKNSVGADTFVE
mmetsp:Transcript_31980/g.77778  ORF Transcript_31980/g.77778 Transcript_31980/m.77778 type:complete len:371 (+) Transcript_31980:142-1254(+)